MFSSPMPRAPVQKRSSSSSPQQVLKKTRKNILKISPPAPRDTFSDEVFAFKCCLISGERVDTITTCSPVSVDKKQVFRVYWGKDFFDFDVGTRADIQACNLQLAALKARRAKRNSELKKLRAENAELKKKFVTSK